MKYLWCMKNPTLPLLLILFGFSLLAQDEPAPTDNSLSISFPHKLELQKVGGLTWKGLSIENARYTEGNNKESRYCRFTVIGAKASGGITKDIADLTGDQTAYLKEDLERLFVIAKSDRPQTYISHRNVISDKVFYYMDYTGAFGWNILMSIGTDYDKKWFKLPIRQLPAFAKTLDTCIEFTKR